jgi:hypothetical protein
MFEHRTKPLLPAKEYIRRQLAHFAISMALIFGSLLIGIVGYHYLGNRGWVDSLESAAMILGGMGQIGDLATTAGKVFASFYALYAGMVFLIAAAVLFAPMLHRFLHRFHLEQESDDK